MVISTAEKWKPIGSKKETKKVCKIEKDMVFIYFTKSVTVKRQMVNSTAEIWKPK